MTPVDPASMPWGWVREGLLAVLAKTAAAWTPADVYLALHNKQAFLYTLGQEDGFVIVQRLSDFTGPYLFVWVIHGRLADRKHECMQALRAIAVAAGCRRLEMRSPRRWEAAKLGWQPKETIYTAEVWPEGAEQ